MKQTSVLLLILILFTASCEKDRTPSWNTEWYGPVANGSITLSDVLEDSLIYSNNQETWFSISRNIFSLKSDSLVKIPDDKERITYKSFFNLYIEPGTPIFDVTKNRVFDIKDAQITRAWMKKGVISVLIKSTYDVPVEYSYEFPGIKKNGKMFTISETVPAATSGTLVLDYTYEFFDFEIDLTGKDHNSFNKLEYNVKCQTVADADTLLITPMDSLALTFKFEKIELDGAEGYFGQKSISLSDTTEIDIFSNIKSGWIDLDSVSADIHISNGLGADLALNVNQLSSISRTSGNIVDLNAGFIGSDISIGRAYKSSTINPVIKNINLNNSNTEAFIENLPDRVAYDLSMQLNPLGNISMGQDFYYADYPLLVDLNLDLPLKFALQDLWFTDTITLELKDNIDPLQSADLQIHFTNYFPVEARTLFTTGSQSNLKTLQISASDSIIAAGIPNSQGMVNTPAESVISLNFTKEIIDALKETGKIKMNIKLNTQALQMLRIYEDYEINYKITGSAVVRINGD